MKRIILLFKLLFFWCNVNGQIVPCQILGGDRGECKSIFECQVLLDIVLKINKAIEDKSLLKSSHCGIDKDAPAVCCPIEVDRVECYTPEGKIGHCITLKYCPDIANLLKPPTLPEAVKFAQNSICGIRNRVCCGPVPKFEKVAKVNCKLTSFPPDPTSGCCGVDKKVQNKLYGGNLTTIYDYPWLVVTEYQKEGKTTLLDNGALISGRYVLTDAGSARQSYYYGSPVNIRLGDYDTGHEGPDCTTVEGGVRDCNDGAIRIPIQEIIIHPMYDPNVKQFRNYNIALIRLTRMAPLTDFIRPICLPITDLTDISMRIILQAAGWADINNTKKSLKLHDNYSLVKLSRCQLKYSMAHLNGVVRKDNICILNQNCIADHVLMYKRGQTYEYVGIVGFGPSPCGRDNIPYVYTNVYSYNDWIKNTIRT